MFFVLVIVFFCGGRGIFAVGSGCSGIVVVAAAAVVVVVVGRGGGVGVI